MQSSEQIEDLLPLTHVTYHVLLVLAGTQLHGYGIIKEIFEQSGGAMDLETGTLYAAIKRLRDEGLIDVAPAPSVRPNEDSRRRYYQLTPFGREILRAESDRLARLVNLAREKDIVRDVAQNRMESP